MIDLHYWPTPNGKKLTIQLEESSIDYKVVYCEIGRGGQFEEEFLRISPNNRMPAIVDHDPEDGGEPYALLDDAEGGVDVGLPVQVADERRNVVICC